MIAAPMPPPKSAVTPTLSMCTLHCCIPLAGSGSPMAQCSALRSMALFGASKRPANNGSSRSCGWSTGLALRNWSCRSVTSRYQISRKPTPLVALNEMSSAHEFRSGLPLPKLAIRSRFAPSTASFAPFHRPSMYAGLPVSVLQFCSSRINLAPLAAMKSMPSLGYSCITTALLAAKSIWLCKSSRGENLRRRSAMVFHVPAVLSVRYRSIPRTAMLASPC